MSTQLIPVFQGNISGSQVQLVDARLLHGFMEVARDFSTWIKKRIADYGFIKDQDYLEVFPKTGENLKGGRPAIDYHLTLDMAKELSMVERNEKGKQARRYFIEMERKALSKLKHKADQLRYSPTPSQAATFPIEGDMVIKVRNGRIVDCKALPEGGMVYDPRSANSVTGLVMHYIPVQQLGTLIDAATNRLVAISRGKMTAQ